MSYRIMKSTLLTGGAGFIGSHLSISLLNQGHRVICVDNLSTGSMRNISDLGKNKNFQFLKGDCRSDSFVELLKDEVFDKIYDLASPASVDYIENHPVDAATVNSIGLKNLLELAKLKKVKILFASSSETYGDPLEHPQKEIYWGNVNPVGVRSGYDEGKRFGEALCMAYYRQFNLDVKIIRIFNTYGPNASPNDSRVIPRFVTKALKNQPLPVHGDGLQTRSLCYVTDLVDGIIRMMEGSITGPVNLGNPDEYTILEIAKKVIEKTKSRSTISFQPRPLDDPGKRKPDITIAKEKLGWEPRVSFEDGLEETISYFKKLV